MGDEETRLERIDEGSNKGSGGFGKNLDTTGKRPKPLPAEPKKKDSDS